MAFLKNITVGVFVIILFQVLLLIVAYGHISIDTNDRSLYLANLLVLAREKISKGDLEKNNDDTPTVMFRKSNGLEKIFSTLYSWPSRSGLVEVNVYGKEIKK